MKIVFVLENYYPHIGGVEVLFKHICEGLAKDNDVTVITHKPPNTKEEEWINHVKIIRVNVPSFASRYFFSFLSIRKVLKVTKDADIINTTTYNAALPARIASIINKKPAVLSVMEVIGKRWSELLEMGWLKGKIHQILERMIVRMRFDRFICISEATMQDLLDVNETDDAVVIYPGIDYDFWDPNKYDGSQLRKEYNLQHQFVYLYYGRPGPSKGFEHLLAAVHEIVSDNPSAHLFAILSTDKAYSGALNRIYDYIKFHKLGDYVTIIPPQPREELPNYIKMADCVVIPSLTEGFGFTTAESCAMKKAVVATTAGSIPEVISGTYYTTQPAYSVGLAHSIRQVYQYPNNLERTPLKKFLWDDCIGLHKELYEEVLK